MSIEGGLVAEEGVPARSGAERGGWVEQAGVVGEEAPVAGLGGGGGGAGAETAEGKEAGAGAVGEGGGGGGGRVGLGLGLGRRRRRGEGPFPFLDQSPGAFVDGVVDGDYGGDGAG